MSTQRKSKVPALTFFVCIALQVIEIIIVSARFGTPMHMLTVRGLMCTIIFPAILGLICFANSRSKLLTPLYLAYALCILLLGGVFRHFSLLDTSLYLALIYICLFVATFLGRKNSSLAGIFKLLIFVLAVVVLVFAVIRIRYMFLDYIKPAYLCNVLLAFNALALSKK